MWSHGYFNQNISDLPPESWICRRCRLNVLESEDVPDEEVDEDDEDNESEWTFSKGK